MHRILSLLSGLFLALGSFAQGGVGINNPTPHASALLDLTSTEKGLLVPRMTTAQRDGIPLPATSLLVYNTTNARFEFFNGSAWGPLVVSGGTLDQAYDFGGPGAGRTITADAGAVLVDGTDGLQVTGTLNSGATLDLAGAGVRMFFYPRKAAFRAGSVTGTQWNDAQIGVQSTAWGTNTIASGSGSNAWGSGSRAAGSNSTAWGTSSDALNTNSTAWGSNSTAAASLSTAWGSNTQATGLESTVWGRNSSASGQASTAWGSGTAGGANSTAWSGGLAGGDNATAWASGSASGLSATAWQGGTASGQSATAWGTSSVASGQNATAFGASTRARSFSETALGLNNTDYTPISTSSFDATDRLLVVGNGITAGSRSNAFLILKNGNTAIGNITPTTKLDVDGQVRIRGGNPAAGRVLRSDATGLATWVDPTTTASGTLDQAYDFGGPGAGRTITADAGAVRIDGVDGFLSTGIINEGVIPFQGAGVRMMWYPGKAAFRAGGTSNGSSPVSWDDVNIGIYSAAFGLSTRASGSYSTAIGLNTNATGNYSFAGGNITTASGSRAFALGYQNTASGDRSTALGNGNSALSLGETVVGNGATIYTPSPNGATQFRITNATDRVFVVGNAIDLNNNNVVDLDERSDAMVILKNGNTAIGNIDPTTKLDVDGQVRIRGGNPAAGRVLMGDAAGLATWVDPTTIPTNAWGLTGNAATNPSTNYIGTSDDQSLVIRTNNSERMRVLNTGNVAIGNANPNTRLDVVAGSTGATTRVMTVRSNFIANNTGTGIALINSTSNTSNVGSEIISVTTNASTGLSDLRFHVHGGGTFGALDERMRILGNGNVGIGTNTPTRRLHVATGVSGATSNANTALLVEGEAATYQHFLTPSTAESGLLYGTEVGSIRGGIFFNNSNATDGMQFRTGGNATRMTLTSAGNLGIGTNTPARRLHVATGVSGATSAANTAVVVEAAGAAYQHFLTPSANESGLLYGTEVGSIRGGIIFNNTSVSDGIQFRTGGNSTRMSITDAGLVGIGTTAPATRLQVNGGIAVTPPAVVSATTLPFVYNAGDRSYIRMGSNGTPANRIVVLENGLSVGQILVVECTATGSNGIRFQNAGNMSVSGLRDLLIEDTITFIWNGTKWLEISYSNN